MNIGKVLGVVGIALLVAACVADTEPAEGDIVLYIKDPNNFELIEIVKEACEGWRKCGVPVFYRLTPSENAIPIQVVPADYPMLAGARGRTEHNHDFTRVKNIWISEQHLRFPVVAHEIGHAILARGPVKGGHLETPLMGPASEWDATISEADCEAARLAFYGKG